jgi:dTDP-4-dehydrorhamnose reductase
LIIHCAALSRSPACEAQPQLAHTTNVSVTECLAQLAEDIPLIFYSSDLVFDGRQGHYTEQDGANPLSVYGETKLAAEHIVLRNPQHLVIRTSLNSGHSPHQQSFDEQMLRAWRDHNTLKLFTDEYRSPILAEATAQATWELIHQKAHGLFHVAGSERLSRWEIGQIIASAYSDITPLLEPTSIRDYEGASRPADTSLLCTKAQALLTFPLPSFRRYPSLLGQRTV